ncbi:MAG: hypothetical protein M3499_07480 [Actinomycetota bacterium]|nr:hypothetical protein [Actinomycetota bacterium]
MLQNHLDNLTCKSLGAVEVDGAEVSDLEDHMEEVALNFDLVSKGRQLFRRGNSTWPTAKGCTVVDLARLCGPVSHGEALLNLRCDEPQLRLELSRHVSILP